MQEVAVHNYREAPATLPDRCLLQTDWYREPNFQHWLNEHGFRVVTIRRHPLDLLISALHFIRHEPATARWLEGNAGLPGELVGRAPCSREFIEYALGFGAENLLSISYQWSDEPGAIKLRYEDAVRDPVGVLGTLIGALGGEPECVKPWLERVSLERMRATPNRHGWQARPGLWKQLIVPMDTIRIFRRHRTVFRTLGYTLEPYLLSRAAALRNWERLA